MPDRLISLLDIQGMSTPKNWKCSECGLGPPDVKKAPRRDLCMGCQRIYYRTWKRKVGLVEDGPTGKTWDEKMAREWATKKLGKVA